MISFKFKDGTDKSVGMLNLDGNLGIELAAQVREALLFSLSRECVSRIEIQMEKVEGISLPFLQLLMAAQTDALAKGKELMIMGPAVQAVALAAVRAGFAPDEHRVFDREGRLLCRKGVCG